MNFAGQIVVVIKNFSREGNYTSGRMISRYL